VGIPRGKKVTAAPVDPDLLDSLRASAPAMAEQLGDLVTAESPSGDLDLLARCAERVAALGASLLGRHPERFDVDGRAHLRWQLGDPGMAPAVVLIGHYDTVWPAGTINRFPFTIDGSGRASGPGSFDMKAGIVQMFHAMSAIGALGAVTCLLTADEEIGSPTSRRLIEETARGARAALILEASAGGDLKIARKGTSMYDLHLTGRAAHAGLEPEKGANATVELAHQVLAIAALGRPDLGTTVTPTVAGAGTTTNTVPASASVSIDVRASVVEEQERIDVALRELRPVGEGTTLRLDGGPNRPPFQSSSSSELLAMARRAAGRLGLQLPAGVAVGGGSDGNFTAALGVPTLDGLGAVGDRAHAEGEYVVLDAMPERSALLAVLVADLLDGT
jgi:glutamate carboxypeptidase